MNKLFFYYGSMNSAKTLRLLTTAYNFEEKGIHFICLKPKIDNRDGEGIIHSRIGIERECIVVDEDTNIYKLIREEKEKDASLKKVFVDECQFLTERQVDELAMVVDTLDVDVMCYGLRTDFRTKSFPASKRLFELADTIEEVKSHCGCGRKATINARFDENDEIIVSGNQVQIGGNESYKALCRKCYMKLIRDKVKELTDTSKLKNSYN